MDRRSSLLDKYIDELTMTGMHKQNMAFDQKDLLRLINVEEDKYIKDRIFRILTLFCYEKSVFNSEKKARSLLNGKEFGVDGNIWAFVVEAMNSMDQEQLKGLLPRDQYQNSGNLIVLCQENHRVNGIRRKKKLSPLDCINILLNEIDPEVLKHSTRMNKMAIRFGKELNLEGIELKKVALVAELHDLGKIGVEKSILQNINGLTDCEWEALKKHTIVGFQIAKQITKIPGVAEGVLTHHEKWDGSGYPLALKERNIPFLARVIAIIDAFDAMTFDRNYREKCSPKEAKKELERCSGSQFDPELVEVFLTKVVALA